MQRSTKLAVSALGLSLILAACGGGSDNDDSGSTPAASSAASSTATSSAKSSTAASSAATSSAAASTASSAAASSAAASSAAASSTSAAIWSEEFNQADEAAFFSSTSPAYAKTGGTITVSGGLITLNGARFVIGTSDVTASTATSAPAGSLDFSNKTSCTATIKVSSINASVAAKSLILYVNNSTSSSALSPLGAASKVGAIDSTALVVGENTITWTNAASSGAFLQLRTETGVNVSIDKATVTCN